MADYDRVGKIWVSVIDGRTTLTCLQAAGQIQPVEQPFTTRMGALMRPPAHIHCRSIAVPYWLDGKADPVSPAAKREIRRRSAKRKARERKNPPPPPIEGLDRGQARVFLAPQGPKVSPAVEQRVGAKVVTRAQRQSDELLTFEQAAFDRIDLSVQDGFADLLQWLPDRYAAVGPSLVRSAALRSRTGDAIVAGLRTAAREVSVLSARSASMAATAVGQELALLAKPIGVPSRIARAARREAADVGVKRQQELFDEFASALADLADGAAGEARRRFAALPKDATLPQLQDTVEGLMRWAAAWVHAPARGISVGVQNEIRLAAMAAFNRLANEEND